MCPSLGQWPKIQSQLKHGVVPHVICLPFWWVLVMIEGMKKNPAGAGFFVGCRCGQRVWSASHYQQYFPSSISFTATSWRAAVVLKGSVLVNRLRPISIIFSSSPSAKARRASLPEECMRSATS